MTIVELLRYTSEIMMCAGDVSLTDPRCQMCACHETDAASPTQRTINASRATGLPSICIALAELPALAQSSA